MPNTEKQLAQGGVTLLENQTAKVFDYIIFCTAIALVPIAVIIVLLEMNSGWESIRVWQLSGFALVWLLALARTVLASAVRAAAIVLLLLFLALSEVTQYGLVSATFYLLCILPILATAGLGLRYGYLTLVIILFVLILIAWITISNQWVPPVTAPDFFFSAEEWGVRIVNFAVAVTVGVFVTGHLFRIQRQALDVSHKKNTELAASRSRVSQAAKLAGLGYAKTNELTGEFLEVDNAFAAMHGSSIDGVMRMDIRKDIIGDRLHTTEHDNALEVNEQLKRGQNVISEFRHVLPNGDTCYLRKIFTPVNSSQPFDGLYEVVCQDVTASRTSQEQLLQSQKMEAIGKLTGGVAHDFNNILAVISGNLELLQQETDPNLRAELFQSALESVARGANLSGQLLAFARKQTLLPVVLNVGQVIKESAQLLRVSAGEAISVEIVSDAGLWLTEVDRTQFEAVILNLIVNARDAMPKGGFLSIEAGNTRLDRHYAEHNDEVTPGQYVCVSVTDSGVGMDAPTLEKAIEPFFTTKEVGKGTGLGLSMAFGFAKQSGGHLKIYSEPGHGTTVKLYLPRTNERVGTSHDETASTTHASPKNLHVLLIEDNDDLRKTLETQLHNVGFTVSSARDGTSALNLAATLEDVDVLLSDVILPNEMDGREVVSRLLPQFPNAAVVFMSGFTENSIIHQGRLETGITLLQKPFTFSELVQAITSEMKRLSDERN